MVADKETWHPKCQCNLPVVLVPVVAVGPMVCLVLGIWALPVQFQDKVHQPLDIQDIPIWQDLRDLQDLQDQANHQLDGIQMVNPRHLDHPCNQCLVKVVHLIAYPCRILQVDIQILHPALLMLDPPCLVRIKHRWLSPLPNDSTNPKQNMWRRRCRNIRFLHLSSNAAFAESHSSRTRSGSILPACPTGAVCSSADVVKGVHPSKVAMGTQKR